MMIPGAGLGAGRLLLGRAARQAVPGSSSLELTNFDQHAPRYLQAHRLESRLLCAHATQPQAHPDRRHPRSLWRSRCWWMTTRPSGASGTTIPAPLSPRSPWHHLAPPQHRQPPPQRAMAKATGGTSSPIAGRTAPPLQPVAAPPRPRRDGRVTPRDPLSHLVLRPVAARVIMVCGVCPTRRPALSRHPWVSRR